RTWAPSFARRPGSQTCLEAASDGESERRAPIPVVRPFLHLRDPGGGPVGPTTAALPAGLDDRAAVVRDQRRHRVPGWPARLERAALSDLVPDRRLWSRRLSRARDGVPAEPDSVRVLRRVLAVPRWPVQLPDHHQVRGPGGA